MKKRVYQILLIVCIIVFLFSAFNLIKHYVDASRERNNLEKLAQEVEEYMQPPEEGEAPSPLLGYKILHEKNPDMIGWVKIEDTRINYPVMQTKKDPEHYLRRDFEGSYALSGLPFLDAACNLDPPSTNLIIYGHNMKSGTMFFDLTKYAEKAFWETHPTFHFDLIDKEQEYQVIAAFRSEIYPEDAVAFRYYQFVQAANERQFNDYIKGIQRLSLYDTNITAAWGDELLTLSTCSYHTTNGRFAVVAKRIIPPKEAAEKAVGEPAGE